jgi:CDP-diacylglycerol--serine O-phosphatidyltransferase
LYWTLTGNPAWAMLLIVSGVGFDGLDGFLARHAGLPPTLFGRVADSVADAITFALAPAALLLVHTDRPDLWAPWSSLTLVAALSVASLAIARLVYFTARGYRNPDFVGVPTPQTALAIVVLLLLFDVPGFLGISPVAVVVFAVGLAVPMVAPVGFPKLRRTSRLRWPMTVTALLLIVAVLPIQFRPPTGSPWYLLGELATVAAAAGLAIYYVAGPFTVPKPTPLQGG